MGGTTASRNSYGQYLRTRAIPTNPNTTFQQAVRSHLANLTSLWLTTLTAAQRDAWATYAAAVPVTDSLGQQIFLSALNHYVRSNVPRLQHGLGRVDAAPTIFDLGDYTSPVVSASEATQQVSVIFNNADEWANEDNAGLLVYCGREQAATINYFKGPYRLAGIVLGNGTTPPTSPATIGVPFAITEANKEFSKLSVTRADGRLSTIFRTGCLIAA